MRKFEWNNEKAKRNLRKHGVAFEDVRYFEFETAMEWLADQNIYGEERIVAIGMLGGKFYALIYTMRGTSIRVISLRRASQKEANEYAKSET
ncbi:BrnT family toxin [Phyllobacterium sp. TAF24]|uniref:BrnT family toxin n=1 Tax=Phyllobacterium sp. TAF24 TaxID=3233068 RepID=UPI003F9DC856